MGALLRTPLFTCNKYLNFSILNSTLRELGLDWDLYTWDLGLTTFAIRFNIMETKNFKDHQLTSEMTNTHIFQFSCFLFFSL